jgi:hypothetical protein
MSEWITDRKQGRFIVKYDSHSSWWVVVDSDSPMGYSVCLIPNKDAAERIAAIYNEVMP